MPVLVKSVDGIIPGRFYVWHRKGQEDRKFVVLEYPEKQKVSSNCEDYCFRAVVIGEELSTNTLCCRYLGIPPSRKPGSIEVFTELLDVTPIAHPYLSRILRLGNTETIKRYIGRQINIRRKKGEFEP